jgi:hypothetical protein
LAKAISAIQEGSDEDGNGPHDSDSERHPPTWFTRSCDFWTSIILLIGNTLILYCILLISQVVSFDEIQEERYYVPKSQQSKLSKMW